MIQLHIDINISNWVLSNEANPIIFNYFEDWKMRFVTEIIA